MNSSLSSKKSQLQVSKFIFCLCAFLVCQAPHLARAQNETPYSFAIGKEKTIQKDENFVMSASESIVTTLRGPRGESLAIASIGLALFSFLTGLKAGAIVFGVLGVIFLGLSHPFIALFCAMIGLAIHRYRNRDYDDEFEARQKAPENPKTTGSSLNPTTPPQLPPPSSSSTPKINRPL